MGYLHDIYHINWCRISSINIMYLQGYRPFQDARGNFLSHSGANQLLHQQKSKRKIYKRYEYYKGKCKYLSEHNRITMTCYQYIYQHVLYQLFWCNLCGNSAGNSLKNIFGGTPARVCLGNHQPSPPENYRIKPSKLCGETRR